MNKIIITTILTGALAAFMGILVFTSFGGRAASPDAMRIAVDEKGNIRLPDIDFRKDWTSLGSWAIAEEEGELGSKGVHVVYTQPETVTFYRETGNFPDGAILIKVLYSTVTEEMTTGTVSRPDKTTGWFVMVKDSTGRFPDNKLWGKGWGWAYFDAKDRINTPTTDYEADCLGCHVPVETSDWVYVQGYPVLNADR